jgi:1,4-alpha-glucan branching enzyme
VAFRFSCAATLTYEFDAASYGGSGQENFGGLLAAPLPIHGRPFSLNMALPPLGVVIFQPESHNLA